MYYFTVTDNIVLAREVRKKPKDIVGYLRNLYPDRSIQIVRAPGDTLLNKCRALSEQAESLSKVDWFISEDEDDAKAGAIVSVIENNRLWRLLMSEEEFREWITVNVR